MPKLPDNDLPEKDSLWLNHGAAKREGDAVPTIAVTAVEAVIRDGAADHLIRYVNVATSRRGSTSFNARFRYRSAFEPAPVPVVEAAPEASPEAPPVPVEQAAPIAPSDATAVAGLEVQRATLATLERIATGLDELARLLGSARIVSQASPGQVALPFAGGPAGGQTGGHANGSPVAGSNGVAASPAHG